MTDQTERRLVRRGTCSCGEVTPENTLGHQDGCRYFSDSVYTYDTGGPEDGHTFRIRYDSRASSKVVGDPEHTDAPDFMGPVHEIQVRAWNLRDALRKAAELPFGELMGTEVDEP